MNPVQLAMPVRLLVCLLCLVACSDAHAPERAAGTAVGNEAGAPAAHSQAGAPAAQVEAGVFDAAADASTPALAAAMHTCDREIEDHEAVDGTPCAQRVSSECVLDGSPQGTLASALLDVLKQCNLPSPYSFVQVRLEGGCVRDLAIDFVSPASDPSCAVERLAELRFECAAEPTCMQFAGSDTLP